MKDIPTYIINLKKRTDRKTYILREFSDRREFKINIVEAIEDKTGAIGLWKTIENIIQYQLSTEDEYTLICEDDHQFTNEYYREYLYASITDARERKADILLGGVSWFSNILTVSQKLLWIEKFSGTQFMIIFKRFYQTVLNADFKAGDSTDYKICSLTNYVFCMDPFISVQKNFGYSDATKRNNKEGRIEKLFENSRRKLSLLKTVSAFYNKPDYAINKLKKPIEDDFSHITIPTYIINLKERSDRRIHIERQFEEKNEFDVTIIEAIKHRIGAVGLWMSIRKIIKIAEDNDDDVIVICEDDHKFTEDYSKEFFIRNIIEAHSQGTDLLSGGSAIINTVVPITDCRFWTNIYYSTQFIVVFKKFYKNIIAEPFDDTVIADRRLSNMTANKMLLFPFISTQKDFGYSDCTSSDIRPRGTLESLFLTSCDKLKNIQGIYNKYNS